MKNIRDSGIRVGNKFTRLTVVGLAINRRTNRRRWKCACSCGNVVYHMSNALTSGHATSCGCRHREDLKRGLARTHGMSCSSTRKGSLEYKSWQWMVQRCENPNHKAYHRYGGRGISICRRWRKSFECFLEDMGSRLTSKHELDRIDNDGNYEPDNCRWATRGEQNSNKSSSIRVEFCGEVKCATEWARLVGMSPDTMLGRLGLGWSPERAITTPVKSLYRFLEVDGVSLSLSDWARHSGVSDNAIRSRLKRGWCPESAVFIPIDSKFIVKACREKVIAS